jgi:hypothetical protein
MDSLTKVLGDVLDPDDLILTIAWIFGALSRGPYPILMISAPQGTGKTSLARILKRIVDPVAGTGVVPPVRTPRDLVALASAQHIACLDNLSNITAEMSDALACVATGGDFSERQLYTNFDLALTSIKRPVLLTSILEIVTRGDLADRCVAISPRRPETRLSERELDAHVQAVAPDILGGLFRAASTALRALSDVQVPQTRMADFAQWVLAGAPSLGFEGDAFMDAYQSSREGLAGGVLEADPVASALIGLADLGPWEGALSHLYDRLAEIAGGDSGGKAWPSGPQVMARALKRLAPLLEEHAGVAVEHHRERRRRFWTVQKRDGQASQGRHRGVTEASRGRHRSALAVTSVTPVTPVTASRPIKFLSPSFHRSTQNGNGATNSRGEGKSRAGEASQASRGCLEPDSAALGGVSPADLDDGDLPPVEYRDGKVII